MRFFRTTLCALLAFGMSGCASIGNSYVGRPLDQAGNALNSPYTASGLRISAQELTPYASRNFGLVEITLENDSTDWVRISRLELDFGDSARAGVSLPKEPDVSAWYRATLQRNDIRDTNEAAALGALVLLGAAVAIAGEVTDKPAAKAAGAVALAGAETALVVKGVDQNIQSVEHPPLYPDTHLLALPFAVPPGLFSKRWLLINTRDSNLPCVRGMLLDYDVVGRGRERVLLRFRKPGNGSEWQRWVCSPQVAGEQPGRDLAQRDH